MANPFLAEIRIVPYTFAPHAWALCDGQLLPIAQNTALFSLIGTFYGGNGITTFALPNMQGCAPMFYEQGPGLSLYDIGQTGGATTVTLTTVQMGGHNHTLTVTGSTATATQTSPSSEYLGPPVANSQEADLYAAPSVAAGTGVALTSVGNGQPHNNLQPYLTLQFIIAMQGVFPSRN